MLTTELQEDGIFTPFSAWKNHLPFLRCENCRSSKIRFIFLHADAALLPIYREYTRRLADPPGISVSEHSRQETRNSRDVPSTDACPPHIVHMHRTPFRALSDFAAPQTYPEFAAAYPFPASCRSAISALAHPGISLHNASSDMHPLARAGCFPGSSDSCEPGRRRQGVAVRCRGRLFERVCGAEEIETDSDNEDRSTPHKHS